MSYLIFCPYFFIFSFSKIGLMSAIIFFRGNDFSFGFFAGFIAGSNNEVSSESVSRSTSTGT